MSRRSCALSILCSTAALLGAAALQASTIKTEQFDVPFAFHIQKQTKSLPAGRYEVQRTPGVPVAVLVNLKTGERARVAISENTHTNGKTTLVFKTDESTHSLKAIL